MASSTFPEPPGAPQQQSWRDRLPRVPDPINVDLPLSERQAFFGWLGIALVVLLLGIGANWYLTDGAWVLPSSDLDNPRNPLGTTEVRFITTHPYDVFTAALFISSTALLGLSVLPRWQGSGPTPYGWYQLFERIGRHRHVLRAVGWVLFALHWSSTALNLFFVEDGDWVNMVFAFASVFVLVYFAYQEFVSRRLGEDNKALRFAAAAVFLASIVWYAFLRIEFLAEWIIETVARHTVFMLHLFDQNVVLGPDGRTGFESAITYPQQQGIHRTVIIILACTAIQSMMIFVAAALAVQKADWRRRAAVIAVTVPLVYILNLARNAIIVFLWQTKWLERNLGVSPDNAFNLAHNWIGKVGSLIALVLIALFVFRVLPEVVHAVIGLLDLPRRRGPLERFALGLPPGSALRGGGVALAAAGVVWALWQPLDGGLAVVAGLIIYYVGQQKARRAREDADRQGEPTTRAEA